MTSFLCLPFQVDALGETVTPVVSMVQNELGSSITADSLSPDTKAILEEVTRYLNLEKLLPSYKYTVTLSCLRTLRKLQKQGHLPSSPILFKDYGKYGRQEQGLHSITSLQLFDPSNRSVY